MTPDKPKGEMRITYNLPVKLEGVSLNRVPLKLLKKYSSPKPLRRPPARGAGDDKKN
jgi:hypothetical protein